MSLNSMRNIINGKIILCVCVIVASCFVMLLRNIAISEIGTQMNIGTINMFLYSAVYSNPFLSLVLPFLIGIISTSLAKLDDANKKYIFVLRKSVLCTAAIVFCTYFLVFLLCLIIDPSASVKPNYFRGGLFIQIYDISRIAYCFVFMFYMAFLALIYAGLSCGVALLARSTYLGMVLPGFCAYMMPYLAAPFTAKTQQAIMHFLPFRTFDICAGLDSKQYLTQLLFAAITAEILNLIAVNKKEVLK